MAFDLKNFDAHDLDIEYVTHLVERHSLANTAH